MMKFFTQHPHSFNETYGQHLIFTLKTGFKLILLGIVLLFHGFLPGIFTCFTSTRIIAIAEQFKARSLKKTESES